jgi:hypothetical protein
MPQPVKFDVSESCIQYWREKKDLSPVKVTSGLFMDKKVIFSEVEEISSHLNERWQFGYAVLSDVCLVGDTRNHK